MKTVDVKPRVALRKILFATDFEAPASRALAFAATLANRDGGRLYAAHVIPREAYALASPDAVERIFNEARDFAGYSLKQMITPLRQRGLQCDMLLSDGDVAEVIHEFVTQYEADLLVVGTSSRGGVHKLLLGSVAEQLIRDSPCPVMTVGPQVVSLASEGIHRIICATDFSPAAKRAAEIAASAAREYDAHLCFVHVIEHASKNSPHLAEKIAEKRLKDAIPAEPALFHEPQVVVQTGCVAERILNLASDVMADLIVMGVRGAGAFAQTVSRFGSTAHRVISEARCPVITVGDISTQLGG